MQENFIDVENSVPIGGYENQIYNEGWGEGNENESGEDESWLKIDRTLAMEVNIPLDHGGELISFYEVRNWKLPSLNELNRLKTRITDEWIKPLNLKQQDIVRASGLGAPYVCYLLKDPNSPNMNRRRKIEAYSVLTELFRKYDEGLITKEHFTRLRNQRVASRFQGPRAERFTKVNNSNHMVRMKRRYSYNNEIDGDGEEEEDGSSIEDNMSMKSKRKQRMINSNVDQKYNVNERKMQNVMSGPGFMDGPMQQNYVKHWVPVTNTPIYPVHPYTTQVAAGKIPNSSATSYMQNGQNSFIAPYPNCFPKVVRTVFPLSSAIDGPVSTKFYEYKQEKNEQKDENQNQDVYSSWVDSKISSVCNKCLVSGKEGNNAVFRNPLTHAFVFLINKTSLLIPILLETKPESLANFEVHSDEQLWDIQYLRKHAEEQNWLSDKHNRSDCICVLWNINDLPVFINGVLEKWKQDYKFTDEEMSIVTLQFLSQFVYLRDIEVAFQALLPQVDPSENFTRVLEMNCILNDDKLKINDTFSWDIRASDMELVTLLSYFISDFQLSVPSITSMFIDLKLLIIKYRKEWVQNMLERMINSGRIQPVNVLPDSLSLKV